MTAILGISYGNALSSIRWESGKGVFLFHIEAENSIQFDSVDKIREEGCFILDIHKIEKIYENRTLAPGDLRLKKVVVQSRPWEEVIRFQFFPGSGVHWKIIPSPDLMSLRVEFHAISEVTASSNIKSNSSHAPSRFTPPASAESRPEAPLFLSSRKLIVIDPGHGGFNKGARTAYTIKGKHYWEKDLVMQYALKLKYLVDQSPNLSAVMTREKDVYVSLGDRVNFAQKHKGDLFFSIHLNASPNPGSKTARGIEIFHWRDAGTDNAAIRYLEKLENDQLLPELPKSDNVELKSILASMLKDALEEQETKSARFCHVLWDVMSRNPYFKKYHRTPVVKNARFVVLANYAMPSLLVEVGFLSNKEEANYLISDTFQWTSAKLFYNGIQSYFEQEDPNFKAHYIK